jgi:hypothetical protein
MATVYRTLLHYYGGEFSLQRDSGDRVVVEDTPFVRMFGGRYMTKQTDEWHYSQREADLAAIRHIDHLRRNLDQLAESIRRPLPAQEGPLSSAPGRAHAGVAT